MRLGKFFFHGHHLEIPAAFLCDDFIDLVLVKKQKTLVKVFAFQRFLNRFRALLHDRAFHRVVHLELRDGANGVDGDEKDDQKDGDRIQDDCLFAAHSSSSSVS